MNTKRLFIAVLVIDGTILLLLLFATMVASQASVATIPPIISGLVVDTNGDPLRGATLQVQDTPNKTQTDANGTFKLGGVGGATPIVLTAWASGYHIGWVTLDPSQPDWQGGTNIKITLMALSTQDNSTYAGFTFDGQQGSTACGLCHREYAEWKLDAHSHAATNPHFLDLYTGTNMAGDAGQVTQWGLTGANPPDPNKPDYGPGFRLDYPNRAGNCATCHTPLVSTTPNQQNCAWSGCHMDITIEQSNGRIGNAAIPTSAHGLSAEGINCEFCHETGNVIIEKDTGLPLPDMPGILSMQLYRPMTSSDQVFFGTLVDVTRPDSYLPLLSQSQFCASCHYGVFGGVMGMGDVKGGTVIYNSYGEWLNSPYSNPTTGKTCQDCHMPNSNADWFVFANQGGLTRDYATLHDHTMLDASNEKFMQNAVTMNATTQRIGDQVQVQVSIVNDKTGHDVPTDAPMRSVILVVEALDSNGKPLSLSNGPVNPDFSGNYAGQPGETFAKVLKDTWTGETPTSAFWRPVTVVSDNRLAPFATDTSQYTFTAPAGASVTVDVQLIYRRAFSQLEQQKGWNDPDLVMAHQTLKVAAS